MAIVKALVLRLWAVLFFPVDWAGSGNAVAAGRAGGLRGGVGGDGVDGARRKRWSPAGIGSAAAIPAVQQLLIGADLEKARLLYLPSVGFCLLAAAAVEMSAPKLRAGAGAAMLAFTLAALLHNLSIWERVAGKSKTVCEAVAACSNPAAVTGLPAVSKGCTSSPTGCRNACGWSVRRRQRRRSMRARSLGMRPAASCGRAGKPWGVYWRAPGTDMSASSMA